ncbi:MAG: ribonuclease J [Clostridia bacterium]|nr:ribonuclease J [Clostridia bacterium]
MAKKQKLKIIPLGGLNEIGKNMTVFEYGDDILLVDCGMAFPEDEMLGIDIVIPDITYLQKNADKLRAIVLTHAHEDHIGSLPYVLRELHVPVYGTRLALGIVANRLKEHGIAGDLRNVNAGQTIKVGAFSVEFIHSNHSIPDATALAIHTPVGIVVHTGDFKIDCTPIDGDMIDLGRLAQLGKKGVLALLSDSTNAERSGYSMSESTVGKSFEEFFRTAGDRRIIVATFASNIHRIQQIFDAAVRYDRKVAISGRSMENIVNVAMELEYIHVPDGVLIGIDQIRRYPDNKIVIITTGSQGETMSALYRMAFSEHRKVEIGPSDLIVISASPIPGNEKLVSRVINELLKKGAQVVYESLADVHVSGHASQEELKLMISLVKPKYFIPVHGEQRHLLQHAELAKMLGWDSSHIFIMDIGKVLELDRRSAKLNGTVPSGRILVDGLGVGDVGNIVLRDRKHLSEDGLIVLAMGLSGEERELVSGPEIVSRGFVYVRESENLMDDIRAVVLHSLADAQRRGLTDYNGIKNLVRGDLADYLYQKTKRKPMILPVIMEV